MSHGERRPFTCVVCAGFLPLPHLSEAVLRCASQTTSSSSGSQSSSWCSLTGLLFSNPSSFVSSWSSAPSDSITDSMMSFKLRLHIASSLLIFLALSSLAHPVLEINGTSTSDWISNSSTSMSVSMPPQDICQIYCAGKHPPPPSQTHIHVPSSPTPSSIPPSNSHI